MINQSIFTGRELRDSGMALAESHANAVHSNWSENAMNALITYINVGHKENFMCEDVRAYAEDKCLVDAPPNNRAWGGIFARASRKKVIKRVGYGQVKNPLAHHANAAVWSAV